jgi:predicted GTPase
MKKLKSYNVCFLGRTGNGKSSLINCLFGTKFTTDPLVSCTKEMYTVSLLDCHPQGWEATTVSDTPGIGEFSNNSKYQRFYEHAISIADCIVLVLTFDRTDAPSQRLLMELKPLLNVHKNVRFIVALNHIDSRIIAGNDNSYIAWNEEENKPSLECEENIKTRIEIIHDKFDNRFLPFQVVPVCAMRNYGIDSLKTEILK